MLLRSALKLAALRVPSIRDLVASRDRLMRERAALTEERDRLLAGCRFVPPGHFYSPQPSLQEVWQDEARLFADPPRTLPGIDLREEAQVGLVAEFKRFYDEMPFAPERTNGLRYGFTNLAYSYSDAIMLYCMIRHLKPRRIIEVGSGHSSCVILDTNEIFFANRIETVFIEPYPDLLLSLLKPGDENRIQIIPKRLQDVASSLFSSLDANDILFIDSTHVAKIGSDVNMVFAEILPALHPGVHVHFHDIFYPFEYPKYWIEEGRAWNEAYMLRCFLQYNSRFSIELMNTFVQQFHRDLFEQTMPLCLRNPGASIWIRAH